MSKFSSKKGSMPCGTKVKEVTCSGYFSELDVNEDSLETDAVPFDEAITNSKEMRGQFQPHVNGPKQPDRKNDNFFEKSLCHGVAEMQISLPSSIAVNQNVQHETPAQSEGQNYGSSTNTPDLLQCENRKREKLCVDVNGRCTTAGGAAGGSGNASEFQTATIPPQESPPPTTKQNYGSSTNTPDLLQREIRKEEKLCVDVNGRRTSAGGAAGGSGNASEVQTATITPQESPPPTTKQIPITSQTALQAQVPQTPYQHQEATQKPLLPKLHSKEAPPPTTKPNFTPVTSQTPQEVQVPRTPNPHQESTYEPMQKPFSQEAAEEVDEHYDVLLLHSEHDEDEAKQFLKIADKAKWKVATRDDFGLTRTKFKSFEVVFKNSSYTVLLITSNFIADIWCQHQYQTALAQSIENPAKRYTVIPVICQYKDLEMPMELSIFTAAKLNNPKIEKMLQKCIKVGKRLQREKEAGLTTTDAAPTHLAPLKSNDEKASLSMDAIYHQLRPELQPGTSAAQVMSSDCFAKLCVILDTQNPLGNDCRRLATNLGFSSHSGVHREKSPTAKILECFFQKEMIAIHTCNNKEIILMKLMKVLNGMHRPDAVQLLLADKK